MKDNKIKATRVGVMSAEQTKAFITEQTAIASISSAD